MKLLVSADAHIYKTKDAANFVKQRITNICEQSLVSHGIQAYNYLITYYSVGKSYKTIMNGLRE